MLTAISVARECGMLESTDKVIVLSAEDDNKEAKIPSLSYKLANKVVSIYTLVRHSVITLVLFITVSYVFIKP